MSILPKSVPIALLISLASAQALSETAPPVAPVQLPQSFKDWTASCDNGRDCQLVAASEDWSQDYWFVHVTRRANAAAKPIVSIGPRMDDIDTAIRVIIDGRTPGFAFDSKGGLTGDPAAFLRAMARGVKAKVLDPSGRTIGHLPTSGASASLRWIDDQQDRENTVTAIVARGSKPQSAVPTPPQLPTIATPPRSTKPAQRLGDGAIAAIKARGECDIARQAENEFHRLDDGHTLGLIRCNTGAYQSWSLAVVIDEQGGWSPAVVEQSRDWSEQYGGEIPWLTWSITSPDFAPEQLSLREFSKGRGLADCGSASSWAWDGEVFRLSSHRVMDECRGVWLDAWPILWRTTNATELIEG